MAQDSETLATFSRDNLKAALTAIGATHEDSRTGKSVNVIFGGGLKANAVTTACQDEENKSECYGTSILATFGKPEAASESDVRNAINEYSYRENFGRAYFNPEGEISVRIYIISDGGISRVNYERQISLWEESLKDFVSYLYKENEE